MLFLTDFADQGVLLPLALVIAVMLAATGWWRGAAAWSVAVGGTIALLLLLKVLGRAYGPYVLDKSLWNPSGHTAMGSIVYGGLLAMLIGCTALPRAVVLLAWAIPVLAFGGTRIALGFHSVAEVFIGAAVGGGGLALLLRLTQAAPLRPILYQSA